MLQWTEEQTKPRMAPQSYVTAMHLVWSIDWLLLNRSLSPPSDLTSKAWMSANLPKTMEHLRRNSRSPSNQRSRLKRDNVEVLNEHHSMHLVLFRPGAVWKSLALPHQALRGIRESEQSRLRSSFTSGHHRWIYTHLRSLLQPCSLSLRNHHLKATSSAEADLGHQNEQ